MRNESKRDEQEISTATFLRHERLRTHAERATKVVGIVEQSERERVWDKQNEEPERWDGMS